MPLSIVEAVGKFIGPENIRWFGHVKGLKGEVSAVLRLNFKRKYMPAHPIHLREGIQIRNFMRGLPECKEWTQEELEKGWVLVIEKLISHK